MIVRNFLKYFAIAVGIQIALLILARFVPGLGDFLLSYVYWPAISLAITFTGATGETAMIWPPVFGLLVGLVFYSLIVALLFSYFEGRIQQS